MGYGKLFSFENDERNGERCTYLVCDFNGRWLKYSNYLCCIVIVKCGKQSRACYVSRIYLELVVMHFF